MHKVSDDSVVKEGRSWEQGLQQHRREEEQPGSPRAVKAEPAGAAHGLTVGTRDSTAKDGTKTFSQSQKELPSLKGETVEPSVGFEGGMTKLEGPVCTPVSGKVQAGEEALPPGQRVTALHKLDVTFSLCVSLKLK